MEATTFDNSWSSSKKISFRFFASYFILYFFPWPITMIPFQRIMEKISLSILNWYKYVNEIIDSFWKWLIPLIGKYILQLDKPITNFTNGSGDTTYDYVLLLTQLTLALFICIIWSFLDKQRKNYNAGYYWLCVILRYYLAAMMFSYGISKVFHAQMPPPTLNRLLQPYGESSPMGLVWTYIGHSKTFSAFVGWSEVICGILLFFRKSMLLGAILAIIVMTNVVAINFCYDVPVKIFSSTLTLMAIYLCFPYLKKIFQILTSQKGIVLLHQKQYLPNWKWANIFSRFLKIVFIANVLFTDISSSIDNGKDFGLNRPKSALYGIYNIKYCIKNNDTIPLLLTDTLLWKQLVFDNYKGANSCRIKLMNDTIRRYYSTIDTIAKNLILYPRWDTINRANFNYTFNSGLLTIKGTYKKDSLLMRFERFDENKFLLMNRGFHWVNEFPFNR